MKTLIDCLLISTLAGGSVFWLYVFWELITSVVHFRQNRKPLSFRDEARTLVTPRGPEHQDGRK